MRVEDHNCLALRKVILERKRTDEDGASHQVFHVEYVYRGKGFRASFKLDKYFDKAIVSWLYFTENTAYPYKLLNILDAEEVYITHRFAVCRAAVTAHFHMSSDRPQTITDLNEYYRCEDKNFSGILVSTLETELYDDRLKMVMFYYKIYDYEAIISMPFAFITVDGSDFTSYCDMRVKEKSQVQILGMPYIEAAGKLLAYRDNQFFILPELLRDILFNNYDFLLSALPEED